MVSAAKLDAVPRALDIDGAGLGAVLTLLKRESYQFVTPSPATHRRVLRRDAKPIAQNLRDVFGWSLPFAPELLSTPLLDALWAANVLDERGGELRSRIRVASLGEDLFVHSAFPTTAEDAVFFGPDTYRFANFLAVELANRPPGGVLVDIGTGSGVGGVVAAHLAKPSRTILTDLNPLALRFAQANAASAGQDVEIIQGSGLDSVHGPLDLVVANPPFIAGDNGRTYRDGGDLHGARISLDWTLAAARQLTSNGRLLLYTGSAIVAGEDRFRYAVETGLADGPFEIRYRELDPDIFGGQLSDPAYAEVDRIAAVGLSVRRV